MYDLSYIRCNLFILHGFITNSQNDQLAVGLIYTLFGRRSSIVVPETLNVFDNDVGTFSRDLSEGIFYFYVV